MINKFDVVFMVNRDPVELEIFSIRWHSHIDEEEDCFMRKGLIISLFDMALFIGIMQI